MGVMATAEDWKANMLEKISLGEVPLADKSTLPPTVADEFSDGTWVFGTTPSFWAELRVKGTHNSPASALLKELVKSVQERHAQDVVIKHLVPKGGKGSKYNWYVIRPPAQEALKEAA